MEELTPDTNGTEDELFDFTEDTTLEETDEADTEADEGTEETDGAEEQGTPEVKIPFDFLGEKGEMPLSEAKEYLQKGKNYDHVKEKLDAAIAEINTLKNASYQNSEKSYVDELVNEGLSEEKAKEIATEVFAKRRADEQAALSKKEADEKAAKEAKSKDSFDRFYAKFPEVKAAEWTPAMREAYAKGESVLEVYLEEQIAKQQNEKSVSETNKKNEEKTVGDVKSAKKTATDGFLEGLFG